MLIVHPSLLDAAATEACLRADGMDTERAATAADAVGVKAGFGPDLVLIDLDLPNSDGLSLVEHLARDGDCAIIVLGAPGERRAAGVPWGAHDRIARPFPMPELAPRVRAVHRRWAAFQPASVDLARAAATGVVSIDALARCLVGPGARRTALTEPELTMLETLIDAAGATVSREWLSRVALGRARQGEDRGVDQIVLKLRRKLAAHTGSERTITSARRQGYVIVDPTRFRTLPDGIG